MLTQKTIGFIGGGNMAEAIIKGLVSAWTLDSKNIMVSDVDAARLDKLEKDYKIEVTQDNREVVQKSDIVILAIKPQVMQEVLNDIHDAVNDDTLVISVMAGTTISAIEHLLNPNGDKKIGVVRTMPNTPALVLEGVTALAASDHASKNDMLMANAIFEAIGKTVDVQESDMDAVTGLSGSGPAYIFMIIEALSDAGVKMGLSRDVSNVLTIQTVLGAAKLAMESGLHPGELKEMVCSPGGTTIAGIHSLEEGGLPTVLMKAVEAATQRSKTLGQNDRPSKD